MSTNKYNVSVKISPHDVYVIWVYIDLTSDVIFMLGMSRISSTCLGMYMWIIDHGCNDWLFIRIIWRYGEMFIGVGILVILPGKAYLLCISVSNPPLRDA